jgi:type IX secretion system PorP/SprF family membrane protein
MRTRLLTIILFFASFQVIGQADVHFSQFDNAPLQVNPANTGLFQGSIRAGVNYRRQWENISTPFQSIGGFADGQIAKDVFKRDILSLGLNVNQDQAGITGFKMLNAGLNIGYIKVMDPEARHYVSLGARVGFGQRSIAPETTTWDNQWTNTGFNPALPSGEAPMEESVSHVDFGGGIKYFFASEDGRYKAYGGAAAYHLNTPSVNFMGSDVSLDTRYMFDGGFYYLASNDVIAIHPQFMWMHQGPNNSVMLGSEVKFILSQATRSTGFLNEMSLALGLYHRTGDALVPMVKLGAGGFEIGMSYDFTVGNLTRVNNGMGGPEFSIIYKANYKKGNRGSLTRFL